MENNGFHNITIIGVGLLGGSLGLAVKRVWPHVRIVGVGHRRSSLDEALSVGAVDEVTLDPAEGVRSADLVVLCTPIGQFGPLLKGIAGTIGPKAIVTDVGSTKADAVRLGEKHLAGRAQFVGSHPIAGSDQRGVAFSRTDLYTGKTCVITPGKRCTPAAASRIERFWQDLGMRTLRLSPTEHDRVLARVSHLPHALAALLVNVQKEAELELAGTGFMDVTRIAGGDPILWRDIFLTNRPAVLKAIDAYEKQLVAFRKLLDTLDAKGLEQLLARAQLRRKEMAESRLRQKRVEG